MPLITNLLKARYGDEISSTFDSKSLEAITNLGFKIQ